MLQVATGKKQTKTSGSLEHFQEDQKLGIKINRFSFLDVSTLSKVQHLELS